MLTSWEREREREGEREREREKEEAGGGRAREGGGGRGGEGGGGGAGRGGRRGTCRVERDVKVVARHACFCSVWSAAYMRDHGAKSTSSTPRAESNFRVVARATATCRTLARTGGSGLMFAIHCCSAETYTRNEILTCNLATCHSTPTTRLGRGVSLGASALQQTSSRKVFRRNNDFMTAAAGCPQPPISSTRW